MTTALSNRRDHLAQNRRMLLGRSLVAAAAGSLPVPLVEEWLSSVIKRRTISRIAESHAVDVSDKAVRNIADGPKQSPEWTEVAGTTIAGRLLSKGWRRLLIGVVAARRTQVAGKNFTIATLFDHYCARLHVGLGLKSADAAELRAIMDRAIAETSGGLSRKMFQQALKAAAKASAKAPLRLANMATRGALKRRLIGGDETQAITEVDEEIERQMAEQETFLSRAVLAIELQLGADSNPYLDDVIDAFEQLWRHRKHTEVANDD